MQANGTFEVTRESQPMAAVSAPANLGRHTIDKRFEGDLQAHSVGEMLSAGSDVAGSAGYVALERVTGRLGGREGSFVLQHSGTMDRGAATLIVRVVPDTGTGELTGLAGSMTIRIASERHEYTFDYTLG